MLSDKVIVVTGGAGLLGRAFVRNIAKCGGFAVVADVDEGASIRVAEEVMADFPDRAEAAPLDITDKRSLNTLIAKVRQRRGRIDAVINNAYPRNRNYGRKLEDVTYKDFCENLDMHLGGYFLVAQQFGLHFREQGGGNIVNMSSVYGVGAPRFEIYAGTSITMPVEYAAIKSAVIHLTRYFAQYFKKDGIRVNCLSPGGIEDGQPESFIRQYNAHCARKGMLEPGDIVGAMMFLLSDASAHITGQNIVVDDGFSL